MDHVWIFPQIQGRVVVFLKMQRCHQIIAVTLCYVNSVKCRTCLPLVLQTKQTRLLTFLPPSVPDFAYILFPLDPMIGYERWSHPIHNTKPQSGTAAATTEEVGSRLREHTSSYVFWGRGGGVSSSKCHTLLYSPSLSSSPKVFYCDGFFIIHIGTSCWLLLKNPPRINLPHINTIYTHICTHMHFLITHTHTGHTLMPVVEHMWRQGY